MAARLRARLACLTCLTCLLALCAGFAFGSTPVAAARQATDQAGVGPHVGDRIRISDASGGEAAAVSVARLEDPYDRELAEPGFRYVLAEVVIEYTGADTVQTESYNFTILDADGFMYKPEDAFFDRLDGPEEGGRAPGQAWGTDLLFQLPDDAVLAQLRYGFTPLVDLRPARIAYGDAISIVGPDRAPLATIAVGPPTDPYEISVDVTNIVLTDERYVVYPVDVTVTGDRPFVLDPADFYVVDDVGNQIREKPRGPYQHDPNGPYLQPDDGLQPGETASGLIKFIMPDGVTPLKVVYAPSTDAFDQFVVLAEVDQPPSIATSQPIWVPPAAIVTPGCEGVVAWADELAGRLNQAAADLPVDALNDPATADPVALREAAAVFHTLASEQAASAAPPIAETTSVAIVEYYTQVAEALEAIALAVESDDSAAIDAAVAALDDTLADQFVEGDTLVEACPELEEVL